MDFLPPLAAPTRRPTSGSPVPRQRTGSHRAPQARPMVERSRCTSRGMTASTAGCAASSSEGPDGRAGGANDWTRMLGSENEGCMKVDDDRARIKSALKHVTMVPQGANKPLSGTSHTSTPCVCGRVIDPVLARHPSSDSRVLNPPSPDEYPHKPVLPHRQNRSTSCP